MGTAAAVLGGWIDLALGRLIDLLMAIPQLIFALLILTVVGSSAYTLILVIGVLESTRVFRLSRSLSVSIVNQDFVDVARLRGESLSWIIFREVVPVAFPTLLAEFGLRFSFVILFISSLSFLGLGLQPPTADWGALVRENASLIAFGDVTPLLPAGAIALMTVAVNLVVDWYLGKIRRGTAL
ncbi:ABC transporter permease [Rhizobium sp. 16-449-1b]|uniref:ABC transporter permease n=1 Tax=Rhizobium sp. 16-449-1b TaxID=2819989 RepID=UPI0032AF6FB5